MWIDSPCVHCQQRLQGEAAVGFQFACPVCGKCNVVLAPPPPPPPPPPPTPPPSAGEVIVWTVLGVAAAAATGLLAYKGVQVMTDQWQGSGDTLEFKASFKASMVANHVRRHGRRCVGCGRAVRRRREFHVDHRKTVKDGGGAWASNAQVRCRHCNLRKGGRSSTWEYATGR